MKKKHPKNADPRFSGCLFQAVDEQRGVYLADESPGVLGWLGGKRITK